MSTTTVTVFTDHKCVDCRRHFLVESTVEEVLAWCGGDNERAIAMIGRKDFFNGSHVFDANVPCPSF